MGNNLINTHADQQDDDERKRCEQPVWRGVSFDSDFTKDTLEFIYSVPDHDGNNDRLEKIAEVVEAKDNDGQDDKPGGHLFHPQSGRGFFFCHKCYLPVKFGARFSTKACMPSF